MTDKTVFWEIFVEDDYDYEDYDDEYADYDDDEIAEAKKWRDDLRKSNSNGISKSKSLYNRNDRTILRFYNKEI